MQIKQLRDYMRIFKGILEIFCENSVKHFNCRYSDCTDNFHKICRVGNEENHCYLDGNLHDEREMEFFISGYLFHNLKDTWKLITGFVSSIGYQIIDIDVSPNTFRCDYGVYFICKKSDEAKYSPMTSKVDYLMCFCCNYRFNDKLICVETTPLEGNYEKELRCNYVFVFGDKQWEHWGYKKDAQAIQKLVGKYMGEVIHEFFWNIMNY